MPAGNRLRIWNAVSASNRAVRCSSLSWRFNTSICGKTLSPKAAPIRSIWPAEAPRQFAAQPAGARWQHALINRNGLRTLPESHALWTHEYLDSNTSVSEQFSPTPTGSNAFSIQGLDFGRDWAVLGCNVTWEMHDCWSMYVNYDIQTNERETVHVLTGGLAHMW